MTRTAPAYAVLCTLVACDVATAGVAVRTTARSYAPGTAVVLTIANRSGETVYSDLCGGEIEPAPLVGRAAAGPTSGRACIETSPGGRRAVAPRTTAVDTLMLSGNAEAGLWRARLALLNARGALLPAAAGTSNRFRVRGR